MPNFKQITPKKGKVKKVYCVKYADNGKKKKIITKVLRNRLN